MNIEIRKQLVLK